MKQIELTVTLFTRGSIFIDVPDDYEIKGTDPYEILTDIDEKYPDTFGDNILDIFTMENINFEEDESGLISVDGMGCTNENFYNEIDIESYPYEEYLKKQRMINLKTQN